MPKSYFFVKVSPIFFNFFAPKFQKIRFRWDQATEGDYVCELGSDMVERCRLDGVLVYPIYAGRWTKEDYFGSMMESWFTLLQVVTLDHWSTNIVRPLLKERWVWCLFFLALLTKI